LCYRIYINSSANSLILLLHLVKDLSIINRILIGDPWEVPGKLPGHPWEASWTSLGSFLDIPGKLPGHPWEASWKPMGSPGEAHGKSRGKFYIYLHTLKIHRKIIVSTTYITHKF